MSREYVQAKDYRLAGAGVAATDTSITLVSMQLPNSNALVTMADFGGEIGFMTIEPETNREENISFTGITQNVNGTATLTGVTRGLTFVSPSTVDINLRQSHSGGSIIRVTNSTQFYENLANKYRDETIVNKWTFTSSKRPELSTDIDAWDTKQLITKGELARTRSDLIIQPSVSASSEATTGNSTAASLTWAHVSVGGNRTLVVEVSTQQDQTISGITYNGDALTQAASHTRVTGNLRTEIWYKIAPDLGTNNIIITMSGAAYISATALTIVDTDQTAPVPASTADADGSSTAPSVAFTTTADNSLIIDSLSTANDPITETPGSGQYVQQEVIASATRQIVTSIKPRTTAGATTMSYTISPSTNWAITAVEVKGIANSPVIAGDLDMQGFSIINMSTDTSSDLDHAATIEYVNNIALAGAPDASETVKGVVEEATQAQVDAGTAVGETGARLYVNPEKLLQVTQGIAGAFSAEAGENLTIRDFCFIANKESKTYIVQYDQDTDDTIDATTKWRAQTFTSDAHANTLKNISFLLNNNGGGALSGNIVVSLFATAAGLPTGAALASVNIDSSTISTNNDPFTADFDDFGITPSTVYAIVINSTGVTFDPGEGYIIQYNSSSAYSGGQRLTSADGTTWSTTSTDFKFVITQGFEPGKIYKARGVTIGQELDVVVLNTSKVGFAQETIASGNITAITTEGIVSGFVGLTTGAQYWADNTGGAISTTAKGYFAGTATSTTEIQITKGVSFGKPEGINSGDAFYHIPSDGIVSGNITLDTNNPHSIQITENGVMSNGNFEGSTGTMISNEIEYQIWGGAGSTGAQTGVHFPVKSGQWIIMTNLSASYFVFYPYI